MIDLYTLIEEYQRLITLIILIEISVIVFLFYWTLFKEFAENFDIECKNLNIKIGD